MSRRAGANHGLPAAAGLAFTLAVALMWACCPARARAQSPSISVAATLVVAPATQTRLVIDIVPPQAVTPGSFLRVLGLPSTAALTGAHSIAPGAWAVPVSELPTLKVLLPTGAAGQSELSITLVSPEGTVVTTAKVTLIVSPGPPPDTTIASLKPPPSDTPVLKVAPSEVLPPPPPLAPRRGLSAEDRERAMRLVKRGNELLADGAVAQARLLYERAADAGLALGAMAMAATYDPIEFTHLSVRGLTPDPTTARKWYERALQLGAPDAAQRLQRLGAN